MASSTHHPNSVALFTNHGKSIDNAKIYKAMVSFWTESTTCYQKFCDSEHVPDPIFS